MATEEGGGAHEIGTANFVFGGAPGMREEACPKLAQRVSCLGVLWHVGKRGAGSSWHVASAEWGWLEGSPGMM